MRTLLAIPLILGCSVEADNALVAPDDRAVIEGMALVQPEPLVDLVDNPHLELGTATDCPRVTILPNEQEDVVRELWQGGCSLEDGTEVDGQIERFDGPSGAWVSGDRFTMHRDDELVFALDGAIELVAEGDLWLIDANATLCGLERWSCEDGPVGMDLAFTVFPASSFPFSYALTVSGVASTGGDPAPLRIDGAWSVDDSICGPEPIQGLVSMNRGAHHEVILDGGERCDSCASWAVQGQPTSGFCGLLP